MQTSRKPIPGEEFMADKRKLEFFLLRYVPDAVKNEFVNIGVVMVEPGANGGGFSDVRFTKDWRRVRCVDPQVDVETLEALEREIRRDVVELKDWATWRKRMEDSFSNTIQLSPVNTCWAEDPAVEIGLTAARYLEASRGGVSGETSARQKIFARMEDAFERAGVLQSLFPVRLAEYTKAGDPLTFEFAYRVPGDQAKGEVDKIKMFHAVSLKANVQAAVNVAARYPKLVPVLEKRMGGTPLLTAVIDDDLDRGRVEVGFALEMMEENGITIAVVAEMPMIAEVARRELRV